ncbi:hypothetical protein HELRODRAFT_155811 [Helobdella robusta]|uniref:Mediator of RNA polymerase II transcription subunit 22 n=1 Tax=Helobdella robusta TaxID=6412 RepID=T1ELM6_HELRO|nr:hypothetical protein HELRODRAFT_155811 [Helobdella robusta]ESO02339.1 hypothetical protein HELRODRAFT_155811 [Helobdella robusta]
MSKSQTTAKVLPPTKESQLKSYQKRLKDDVRSMYENFSEIFKLVKIDEDSVLGKPSQAEQDRYEIEVRAANMVRAAESLMRLVSEIKQFLILNDFAQVNEALKQNVDYYMRAQNKIDSHINIIREEMINELYDLEEEYYSSQYK